ncbi:MAG: WXG100 family type VII secretion target [Ruminococcus sp.]|nr:WXG100 family type VII secretion target [Ruminococcus sp.]
MAEIRKVDPEVMVQQANVLDSLTGEWSQAVKEITALKEELDAMWDGLSNDQFNARWENDLNKYNSLQVVLESYRRAIQEAAQKFEQYESEIANIVKEN